MAAAHLIEANGARIPALGLGTWRLEGEGCARMVAGAISAGYRHIDTAQMYKNEEAVGDGLRASGLPRDEIFVTTKVWYDRLTPDGSGAARSMEESLKRLGLDRVDLALIHWPQPGMDGRTMGKSLDAVAEAGMARHVGVSNFTTRLLDEIVAACGSPIVANQCEYHPELDQSRVIAACRRHGAAFVSYSPLGKGALPDHPAIRQIAEANGKSPGQVILRWHVQQEGVAAIPKTSNPDRAKANLDVFDFSLSGEEMDRLNGLARKDGRKIDPDWAPDWDE